MAEIIGQGPQRGIKFPDESTDITEWTRTFNEELASPVGDRYRAEFIPDAVDWLEQPEGMEVNLDNIVEKLPYFHRHVEWGKDTEFGGSNSMLGKLLCAIEARPPQYEYLAHRLGRNIGAFVLNDLEWNQGDGPRKEIAKGLVVVPYDVEGYIKPR